PISIIDVQENLDRADLSAEIASSFFERCPELDGIYITGGGKGGLVPAVRSKPMQDKHCVLIGHDLTDNAVTMLQDHIADYIINQRAEDQGYLIIKTLFEYLYKDIKPASFQKIPIELMIRESL
ncbi:MAG: substrate-binding domain-containing protein, partial [Firmicutes bacterium]|nr:substrate-binding domain-containing protein [Bacillota bacterium]